MRQMCQQSTDLSRKKLRLKRNKVRIRTARQNGTHDGGGFFWVFFTKARREDDAGEI